MKLSPEPYPETSTNFELFSSRESNPGTPNLSANSADRWAIEVVKYLETCFLTSLLKTSKYRTSNVYTAHDRLIGW